jgi:hypothetical protein
MRFISKVILYTLILTFSLPIFAQKLSFYSVAYMPAGPLAGHRLDTSKLRGLVLLKSRAVPNAAEPNYAFVGNVSHQGKFYVAKILIKAVQSVSFVYEKFTDMPGGHADNVYHFDPKTPVELIYEITEANNFEGYEFTKLSHPIKLTDLVLTAEAVSTVNDKPSLVEGGLTGQFAMAHRLTSVPERLINPVVVEGRKTTVFNIPLDHGETIDSFWNSVISFSKVGMSKNYNLLTHSCITSAIESLSYGLSDVEKALLQKKINKVMVQLNRLSVEDLNEHEIDDIVKDFLETFKIHGEQITSSPIQENEFFMKYLTNEQKESLKEKTCAGLFK